jgi:hypothetical protein
MVRPLFRTTSRISFIQLKFQTRIAARMAASFKGNNGPARPARRRQAA